MNKPTSLKELAELAITTQGMSARQVALKAERSGYGLTHTTLNQMRKGTYKSEPREDTLKALAWLAGIQDDVAFAAAGKKAPGPPLADELPPGSDNLSPRSRKVVVDMLRVLIDLEGEEHEQLQKHQNPTQFRIVSQDYNAEDSKLEQKNDAMPDPELLAAHHDFRQQSARDDDYFDQLGEESQDQADDSHE